MAGDAALDAGVEDSVLYLCRQCQALFAEQTTYSQHRIVCSGDPKLAPCHHFACPRDNYLKLITAKVTNTLIKTTVGRKRKAKALKSHQPRVTTSFMMDTKNNSTENIPPSDAPSVSQSSGVTCDNESPVLSPGGGNNSCNVSQDLSGRRVSMRKTARKALKKFTELSDSDDEETQTDRRDLIRDSAKKAKIITEEKQNKKESAVIPDEITKLIATTRLELEQSETIENSQEKPVLNVDLSDLCKSPVMASVSKNDVTFTCKFCQYTTDLYGHMMRHARTHKENGEMFSCTECDFKAKFERILRKHVKARHRKSFLCTFCTFQCGSNFKLKLHMQAHTGEKPIVCDQCGYSCRQKKQLISHQRKHTGELLRCQVEGCEFSTIYEWALRNHQAQHNPVKKYVCEVCPYQTSDRSAHVRHTKIHNKVKDHKCAQCSYTAVSKHEVTKHMRSHTHEKIYFCNKCSYSTAHPGSLRAHLMVHQNLKPFICSQCQYSSTGKAKVQRHIDKQHGGDGVIYKDLAANLGDITMAQFRKKDLTKENNGELSSTNIDKILEAGLSQDESQEVTLMYKCSSCELLFPSIDAFNLHLNDCQGKVKTAAESIISLGQEHIQ